ncbi:MAG TPA: hypothetical protein VEI28_03015 [Thermodesulfovibrionales bacterium]|nr:hypothetical protein [Thermodesulfovibrionales bacterium]
METGKSIPFNSGRTATAVCRACEQEIGKRGSFTCKQCRKSPFCLEHLDREFKVCPGCAAEERIAFYSNLVRQERNLTAFLRFSQFIFIVVAILFAAGRFFRSSIPSYIRDNVFFEYLFLWGGLAALGMVCCILFLPGQRKKIREIDGSIRGPREYRKYSAH